MRHVAAGVDLVIAQGYEAGGHTGDIGTMVLVPEIVDAVAPVPVLAAGGIGGGRQMAAALALGAEGVWCGSVWLTTDEAETHPLVKEKFLAATSSDTAALAQPHRQAGPPAALRVDRRVGVAGVAGPAADAAPADPRRRGVAAHRPRRQRRSTPAPGQLASYFVGQIVGTMNEVKPAGRVVRRDGRRVHRGDAARRNDMMA